jgi:S-adenosylmethionine:tRNA ribosyltransferase-isomerase
MCKRVLVERNLDDGRVEIQFDPALDDRLTEFGEIPLPPYIHAKLADSERYQTVYSHVPGSAAAPTAGLHLSEALFREIADRGVNSAEVTLQIGLDTFRPVTVESVADHKIHREWCAVPAETSAAIDQCARDQGRVVAIGTTSARTLETWGALEPALRGQDWSGWTDIFITPGYRWTTVDAMLTNFHLPKSTLLMMITSLAGQELTMAAYRHAVEQRYQFFSFGDAMLIV